MNAMEQKLVDALRSGKYRQAHNALRDQTEGDAFCCLGVNCDINPKFGHWSEEDPTLFVSLSGHIDESVLPPSLMAAMGWDDGSGMLIIGNRSGAPLSLATLNDEGFTFDQIADVIAAGLVRKED